jgi:hypothetical protein
MANFAVVGYLENLPGHRGKDIPHQKLVAHASQAIQGTQRKYLFIPSDLSFRLL